MSKPLGPIQEQVLAFLRQQKLGNAGVATWIIAAGIFDVARADARQTKAVQRALRSLEQRGLVERTRYRLGESAYWLADEQ